MKIFLSMVFKSYIVMTSYLFFSGIYSSTSSLPYLYQHQSLFLMFFPNTDLRKKGQTENIAVGFFSIHLMVLSLWTLWGLFFWRSLPVFNVLITDTVSGLSGSLTSPCFGCPDSSQPSWLCYVWSSTTEPLLVWTLKMLHKNNKANESTEKGKTEPKMVEGYEFSVLKYMEKEPRER